MPTFVIEREVSGASTLTAAELKDIAARSNDVAAGLGVPYKWVTSYVAGNKIYCVHEADSRDVIARHSATAGFPANSITEISATIGPQTANQA